MDQLLGTTTLEPSARGAGAGDGMGLVAPAAPWAWACSDLATFPGSAAAPADAGSATADAVISTNEPTSTASDRCMCCPLLDPVPQVVTVLGGAGHGPLTGHRGCLDAGPRRRCDAPARPRPECSTALASPSFATHEGAPEIHATAGLGAGPPLSRRGRPG